jgi:hypothetical protein
MTHKLPTKEPTAKGFIAPCSTMTGLPLQESEVNAQQRTSSPFAVQIPAQFLWFSGAREPRLAPLGG